MFLKYNLPTLLWATVILVLTLLPTVSLPVMPAWELISFATFSHAFVFWVLAVLMLRGFYKQTMYLFLQRNAIWLTFAISIVMGIAIEWLQTVMGFGRQGDIMDVVSNSIGTVTGIISFIALAQSRLLRHFLR